MADGIILELLKRITAMFDEAITPIDPDVGVDVHYRWPYQQNKFPYVVSRLGGMTVSGGGIGPGQYSTDVDEYQYTIISRMLVGNYTQGIATDVTNNVYDYIVQVEDYFRQKPQFATTTGTYSSCPDWLLEDARMASHTGYVAFSPLGGVGQAQLGCEFTFIVPILREVY
jgi:hypothetical protein